jgi:ubiquinone/menaquinone biosynthesis C-methylase UbiE
MLQFDAETARRIEATYTTPDVVAQRREVRRLLAPRPGEHIVDIGAGPGFLAAEMAAEGARVVAVDPSASMRELARARGVDFAIEDGSAEALPLPDASVDAAVAAQVLEYVPDVPGALAEMRRVLRPGGRVLLLDTDWDSVVWHSSDADRTRAVLAAWEEHLADPYLPRTLGGALREAGFTEVTPSVWPLFNAGDDRDTFSNELVPVIAAFVVGRRGVTAETAQGWVDDLAALGEATFFSINRYLFRARLPGGR